MGDAAPPEVAAMSAAQRPGRPDPGQPVRAPDPTSFHDVARIIERMQRRFLDVVRVELERRGADDLSPVQALMLMLIADDELSVRDLMERGYYLGSNASYNLKNLVESGYVDRAASQRDRRSARLRLSAKGQRLYQELLRLEVAQAEALVRNDADREDLATTYRMLRRLERVWSDLVRYSGRDLD